MFIICLEFLCTTNVDESNKRRWFHIEKGKKQTISHRNYHDADYADVFAILANTSMQAEYCVA